MKSVIRYLTILACGLMFASPSAAQWVHTNGPGGRGGRINSIISEGSNIIAGSNEGLYVSSDRGTSWLDATPTAKYNFTTLVTDFPVNRVSAGGQELLSSTSDGIYESSDNGTSWGLSNIPELPGYVYPSAFVLSGTKLIGWGVGLSYYEWSTDNGATWKDDTLPAGITDMAAQDSIVYAATDNAIYLSTDYGSTWRWVHSADSVRDNAFVYMPPQSAGQVFAGIDDSVLHSTDYGATWKQEGATLPCNSIQSMAVTPPGSGTDYVFAGTDSGVFRSSDSGKTWSSANSGLSSTYINCVSFGPGTASGNPALFAGTDDGIFKSTDYGESWTPCGIPNGNWGITASGSDLFAASTFYNYTNGPGYDTTYSNIEIYKSSDDGLSWDEVDSGISQNKMFKSIASAANASGGSSVFVGGGLGDVSYGEVFSSSDEGSTWIAESPHSGGGTVEAMAADSSYVFAAAGGIFRSSDGGNTWTETDSDFATAYGAGFWTEGSIIYAGAEHNAFSRLGTDAVNTIFVSTDRGETWNQVQSNIPSGASLISSSPVLTCLCAAGAHLLVGMRADGYGPTVNGLMIDPSVDGLYVLSSSGTRWTVVDSALARRQVLAFAEYHNNVFAATDSGVFRSTDNGNTWADVNSGMPHRQVTSLAVSGSYLYAATCSGVWKRPLSELTSVNDRTVGLKIPESYSLSQNYPNPFNPTTQIDYTITSRGLATLTVYNVLGQRVATLFSGVRQPGSYTATFDASGLASGVYLYRLRAGSFIETRKALLVK